MSESFDGRIVPTTRQTDGRLAIACGTPGALNDPPETRSAVVMVVSGRESFRRLSQVAAAAGRSASATLAKRMRAIMRDILPLHTLLRSWRCQAGVNRKFSNDVTSCYVRFTARYRLLLCPLSDRIKFLRSTPGRGRLPGVLLGRLPSLHALRRRLPTFVR